MKGCENEQTLNSTTIRMPPHRASASGGSGRATSSKQRAPPFPSSSKTDDYSTSESFDGDVSPVTGRDVMNERIFCNCMACKGLLLHMQKITLQHIDKNGLFEAPPSTATELSLPLIDNNELQVLFEIASSKATDEILTSFLERVSWVIIIDWMPWSLVYRLQIVWRSSSDPDSYRY
ncbi:hypothetical protein R1flu_009729 [Riccia fluitans]|uniref:Uncharacterized protein n=1 Tax=Riccia fluitans TaxID=41844 RepID=A0ABD1Z5Y7_9MARC